MAPSTYNFCSPLDIFGGHGHDGGQRNGLNFGLFLKVIMATENLECITICFNKAALLLILIFEKRLSPIQKCGPTNKQCVYIYNREDN